MGNIGEEQETIEILPVRQPERVPHEPSPAPTPAPAPKEPVPA